MSNRSNGFGFSDWPEPAPERPGSRTLRLFRALGLDVAAIVGVGGVAFLVSGFVAA